MASSDLLIQSLLGGQQAMDPAVAAFQPRMSLAQSMLQQGTDASPTTKWGGLSRLAAALTGGLLLNQNQEGLQGIADQRAKDAAAFGASLGDTLTPPGQAAAPIPQASAAQPNPNQPGMNLAPTPGAGPGTVPPELMPHFQAASARTGIPLPVLLAQARQESTFRPEAVGPGGGVGVMQVQPGTAVNPGYGMSAIDPATLKDPEANINFGADYLAARGKDAGVTDWNNPDQRAKALTAYNGGGDPDYVAHVDRYLPPGGPGQPTQVAGPGAPTAGVAPTGAPGPPQQVTQAPQPPAQPPQVGASNPYVAKALQTIHQAQAAMIANPYNPQIQKAGQMAIDNAHTMMGMDTFVTNPNGTQTNQRTGEGKNAAEPLAHYVQTPTGSVDTTGTHAPTYMPSPRLTTTPAGETISVGPGGIPQVIAPADNSGIAGRKAAESQGAGTGTAAVGTVGKMVDLGREADTAIGNIDYGMNQLHQASAGGIQSGYFAPWLATAAAAGKSLGIDTKSLGVDPQAVGNIQSAQKTLGVVAGAILQNAIGKDSAITDAKIEHFIHTQPGIETDPEAIQRVLGWARSQFAYNRGMAMDAMDNVNPDTGMIKPGWQASYYKKAGAFAPIYDPLSQEMKQPAGEAPAAAMPAATPQQQAAPGASSYREGQVATHSDGRRAVFTGGKWVIQ